MIYEFRTYTLQPRTQPEFLKRWTDALPKRLEYSRLAAFWMTEIGPLNQVIHVWEYKDVQERGRIREEVVKAGIWPPKTSDMITDMKSEIMIPQPFSPLLTPSNHGPYFEMRTYTVQEGSSIELLHARFREHTSSLFKKHGMQIVGYWQPVSKPNVLVYMLAYKDNAARDASWAAFNTDPEWVKVRTEMNVRVQVESVFMGATDYSPIK